MTIGTSLWLGTEDSFSRVLQARQYQLEHPERAQDVLAYYEQGDDKSEEGEEVAFEDSFESYLIQVEGSVGIINILGPTVAEDSWVNQWFGLISYQEISRALKELVESPEINKILLNQDTPGGDVAGLEAVSDTIKWAQEYKEVHTHTSGGLFSAGYWTGAATKRISATRMSEVGSIGVLIVHRSLHDYLEKKGVEYTVIRAGKFKALGHFSEPLSKEALDMLEGKAQMLYGFFLDHITANRAALSIATKESWAEGRTFFGEEALELGLIDQIATLSDIVEKLDVDKTAPENNNGGAFSEFNDSKHGEEGHMAKPSKQVLLKSKQAQAALANGAALEQVAHGEVSEEVPPVVEKPTGEGEAAVEQDAETLEISAEEDQTPPQENELTNYLQKQTTALTAEVAKLTVELTQVQAQADSSAADLPGLVQIAEKSLQGMQVALGSEPLDLTGLPAATLIAQHAKVRGAFEQKYHVGQQSKPLAIDDNEESPGTRLGIFPQTPNSGE